MSVVPCRYDYLQRLSWHYSSIFLHAHLDVFLFALNFRRVNGGGDDQLVVPFPSDPTAGFHNYTISWLKSTTSYYFDKTALKGPTKYMSVNPSKLIINHWSNGNPQWTQGESSTCGDWQDTRPNLLMR